VRPEDILDHVAAIGAAGNNVSNALNFAAKCVAIASDKQAVASAFVKGVERNQALIAAREIMRKACPHPKELTEGRDGGFDAHGTPWCTVYFCAACGTEVDKP